MLRWKSLSLLYEKPKLLPTTPLDLFLFVYPIMNEAWLNGTWILLSLVVVPSQSALVLFMLTPIPNEISMKLLYTPNPAGLMLMLEGSPPSAPIAPAIPTNLALPIMSVELNFSASNSLCADADARAAMSKDAVTIDFFMIIMFCLFV